MLLTAVARVEFELPIRKLNRNELIAISISLSAYPESNCIYGNYFNLMFCNYELS